MAQFSPETLGEAVKQEWIGQFGWPDPEPLPEGLPPVPELDDAMIPEPFRGWIKDVSDRMQIPPDFSAAPVIVVAASLIGRKIGIHPKQRDD